MSKWLQQLKKSGGAIGLLADLLSLLGQNWGAVVSLILALGFGVFDWAFRFLQDAHVQTFGEVFLWSLWSYIGISILYRLHNGIKTSPVVDYAFGVIIESLVPQVETEEDGSFQLVVNFRNICVGAIRLTFTEVRLILDGRTNPDKEMAPLVLPRLATKGLAIHPFKKQDFTVGKHEGTLAFTIEYGPHDGAPVRRMRGRYKVNFTMATGAAPWGFGMEHVSEEDTAI